MPIFVNGKEIKSFVFPGGEVQVSTEHGGNGHILAQIQNSDDIMKLLLTTDAMRRRGYKNLALTMPYIPYARQDRVCNLGEAHSLKVFANLINGLNFDIVHVFDPHSDVSEALFDNLHIVKNHGFVRTAILDIFKNTSEPFHLVSPDAGAYKKVSELGRYLAEERVSNFEILQCGKSRDTKTGALTGFTVGAEDLEGKPCIIVDDIVDGGGTFLGLAAELRKKNAGKLYLVASHGIFSQGFEKLAATFDGIVFTNSFKNFDALPENVKMYNAVCQDEITVGLFSI